jgi:hypothetical protein
MRREGKRGQDGGCKKKCGWHYKDFFDTYDASILESLQ